MMQLALRLGPANRSEYEDLAGIIKWRDAFAKDTANFGGVAMAPTVMMANGL